MPGFDALCALSKGLGVSLDWLVLGAEFASHGAELLVERVAYDVVKMTIETIMKYEARGQTRLVEGGRLLNMFPEEWGFNIAFEAREIAKKMVEDGVTMEELLTWHELKKARIVEMLNDKFDAIKEGRLILPPLS